MHCRKNIAILIVTMIIFLLLIPGSGLADKIDDRIFQLNQTIAAQNLPWKAGRTKISEMSPEERRSLLGGPMAPVQAPASNLTEEGITPSDPYSGGAFPATFFDWRSKDGHNWMTPVTDQMCGDCWAHATCGSMEVRLRYQKGGTYGYELPINLSERAAVTCSPHGNCSAWNIPGLLDYIQSTGIPDEDCLPYSSALDCSDRCSNWAYRAFKVTSHGRYDGPSTTYRENVANSCYNFGPIAVWMMVYSDFWDYESGIYVKSSTAYEEGGHFVVILGWGSSGGVDYWICKNSWGTDFGVNGYFYIRRGTNESKIEQAAYWLTPQNLPNLDDSTPSGWAYPIVPRGDATATSTNAQVPATLPGNANSTYWNVNWKNEGTVMARDNVTHLSVDDIYTYWFSLGWQSAGYESKHVNYGASTVRGGRHTICQNTMDFDDRVWEYDENDNTYCRQFIWSPYNLSNNTPITRTTAPPKKNSMGYSYYNCDGFSFYVAADHPDNWWSAVGVLPSSTSADFDVRLHDIGTYTGAEGGFGSYLEYSAYSSPTSASDFVIVNDNQTAAGTYYAGVLNDNDGYGAFRIEEDTSEKIFNGTNGPYTKVSSNVLDIYEYFINTVGDYGFKLEQTSGTCDLGMTLYDDETTTASKSDYMSGGFANSNGDGDDEYMRVTIPDTGFHGLVVWKADASDYGKNTSYKIKVGPCATPSALSSPSPTDDATNVSINTDLDWADSSNTEYYEVWLKEGSGAWAHIGDTETSFWSLGTLNEATTYEWFIRANNICGTNVYVYWSFTTEDNTPPVPNPMTFSTIPYENSTSTITMIASIATDPTPSIAYYFDFTSSPTGGLGGSDSGWVAPTIYTDGGLSTNHQYGYRVYAMDGSFNMTTPSAISYDYTDIEASTGVVFGIITNSTIQVRSSNTPSNLASGSSGLDFSNDTAGTASGWQQNNNFWTSTLLKPNTKHQFRAHSRNGDKNETVWSPTSSRYTLANPPAAAAFSNVTQTSIRANWSAAGNPAGTEYFCQNTTTGSNSGWTTNTYWNNAGLTCETTYSYLVRARNHDNIETGQVNLGAQATLACSSTPCPGDFDDDGDVDGDDMAILVGNFGRNNCTSCDGDFDNDGDVDGTDFAHFLTLYGRPCP